MTLKSYRCPQMEWGCFWKSEIQINNNTSFPRIRLWLLPAPCFSFLHDMILKFGLLFSIVWTSELFLASLWLEVPSYIQSPFKNLFKYRFLSRKYGYGYSFHCSRIVLLVSLLHMYYFCIFHIFLVMHITDWFNGNF